jgi:AGZA family xanthine/uracil permease-like MFS transporter
MDKYFDLLGNNSNSRTEIIAGVTTFLATMYIVVVNPAIISHTGMPFSGVLTATVLVTAFSSIAMGLYANNPIVLAPGMGINAFFTYTVVLGMGVRWETALGAVFWAGIVFILLSVFNVRTHIVRAIPLQLRCAVAAGIGLFITLIGFINAGFIASNTATIIGRSVLDEKTLTFLAGMAITAVLVANKTKGALILGIVVSTIGAAAIGRLWGNEPVVAWQGLVAAPDFSTFWRLDLVGSLKFSMWPVIFALLFTDMFDSLSTFVGIAEAGNIKDDNGDPRNIKQSLIVDAFATTISGLTGTSSGTSYIESAAGIEEGGRTGLTAVVAGLLFLPLMFFSPLLSIVPAIATAPALVLVGVFMIKPVISINWAHYDDAIPAFLAMFLIPMTYSITQGIIWGFLSWTVIKIMAGKREDITPTLLVIDMFAILSLLVE